MLWPQRKPSTHKKWPRQSAKPELANKEIAELRKKLETTKQEIVRLRLEKNTQSEEVPAYAPEIGSGSAVGHTIKDCDLCPELVVIPSGEFVMGSPSNEDLRNKDEGPQHTVRIGYTLAVGKYEVTRGEFANFVHNKHYKTEAELGGGCDAPKNSGGWFRKAKYNWRSLGFEQTDRHPVACVSWNDAQAYIQWLNGKSGQRYRLLTEAEWEYAARAGSTSAFSFGDRYITPDIANYDGNYSYDIGRTGEYRAKTVPVDSFIANAWGLYNVHGNVWEWVEDCYKDSYNGVPHDGNAMHKKECSEYVQRGGSWVESPGYLRSATRDRAGAEFSYNVVGFRLARVIP